MTTSIERSMPDDLVIEDGTRFGVYRPGNIVTKQETGLRRSRSFGEHNLATYNMRFTPRGYSAEVYEAMIALLEASAVNAFPFWVKEPISKPRLGVPGELTDGTRTTFINPLDIATPVIGFDGEVDELASTRTQHAAANILTDIQANAVGGVITGTEAAGTCTIQSVRYPVLDGQSAFHVAVGSAQANVGVNIVNIAHRPAILDSTQEYTVGASFLPTDAAHSYQIFGQFYDDTTPTGSFNTASTGNVGEWLHLRASGTSASGDDTLHVRAMRTTSSADDFMVACIMVAPGDFERWFLPSLAPRLTEWAAAPATDKRLVFAGASCERWARVALSRNQHGATMQSLGDTAVQQMTLTEALFS